MRDIPKDKAAEETRNTSVLVMSELCLRKTLAGLAGKSLNCHDVLVLDIIVLTKTQSERFLIPQARRELSRTFVFVTD